MPRQVFISYAGQDAPLAMAIVAHLETAGYSTWYFERDSVVGASDLPQTREAIEHCSAFLLVISRDSIPSNDVGREVETAREFGKPILPILVGLTQEDVRRLNPSWDQAAGNSEGISIPSADAARIWGEVVRALQKLGILPSSSPSRAGIQGRDALNPLLSVIEQHVLASKHREAAALILKERIAERLLDWGYSGDVSALLKHLDLAALSPEMGSRLLGHLGMACRNLGEYEEAQRRYDQALALAQQAGDTESECNQLINLGDVLHYLGDHPGAIAYHLRAKALLDKGGLPRAMEARNSGCLANAHTAGGDRHTAERLYEQAAFSSRAAGDHRQLGIWLGGLGNIYGNRGEYDKSIQKYEQARALARAVGDRRNESWWLGVLGDALHRAGEEGRARELLQHALSISDEIGFARGVLRSLQALVETASTDDQRENVEQHLRRLVALTAAADNPAVGWKYKLMLNGICLARAQTCLSEGRPKDAIPLLEEAVSFVPDAGVGYRFLGHTCMQIGKLRRDAGALQKAITAFSKAIEIFPSSSVYQTRAACHYYAGDLQAAIVDYEEAIRLDPAASGAILSKMESEFCLGRYQEVWETFRRLDYKALSPQEKVIAAAFMSLALAMAGQPFTEYVPILQDSRVSLEESLYDPTDMEPHFEGLLGRETREDRVRAAREICRLFLDHYRPAQPDASPAEGKDLEWL